MDENKLCNNLLVGISGSIHGLQIYNYLRLFRESLAQNIKIIMTVNATHFVDPKTLELFTNERIFIDLWDQASSIRKVPHIELSRWAELFVVVPATADIMGKAANGIADDLLSTTILSYNGTIVFVPAMNISMWKSKPLQRNIKVLEGDGHYIVSPDVRGLAAGTGEQDAVSSVPDIVLLHLKHVRMRQLRNDYWQEATREKPLTPMEKILRNRIQRAGDKNQSLV